MKYDEVMIGLKQGKYAPAELHDEIKAAAEEENRTISNLIRTAMIAYLKQRQSK